MKSKSIMFAIAGTLALSVVFTTHSPAAATTTGQQPSPCFVVISPDLGYRQPGIGLATGAAAGCCGVIPTWIYRQPSLYRVWPDCYTLGLVRGAAFIDKNADGKWEAGEPIFGEAWYKVTGGGVWFTCGWVGSDATFGVPVNPGTYYVMPVAPKGYRTTTPRIAVTITNDVNTPWLYMGFVADPSAKGDACDQYNPPR